MTVLGYDSTVQVTLNDMIHHGKAVKRGASDTFIVVDMPIGTVGLSDEEDLKNALKLYQNTNANAVKVEGAHLTSFIQKATKMGMDSLINFHINMSFKQSSILADKKLTTMFNISAKDFYGYSL